MKTESIERANLWPSNAEVLAHDITSILSNLEDAAEKSVKVNMLSTESTKAQVNIPHINYVVLNEKCEAPKKLSAHKDDTNLDQMLYYVCNLCPFLCTTDEKIKEHVHNAHKTKSSPKLPHLKCPGCANVFFHKMSLRSHLIHDHGVGNSDINLIIQTVVHYATKTKNEAKARPKGAPSAKIKPESPKIDKIDLELPKVELSPVNEKKIVPKVLGGKLLHKCSVFGCKVMFQQPENLTIHEKCHTDVDFACMVCNEKFSYWKTLVGHLWRLHKIDMELYSCDQCNYKTVSLATLNNVHKLTHGEVRDYICSACGKAFKNSKQLGTHRITHRPDSERVKFVCEFCSKFFFDKRQLKLHMKGVHEKLKPYLCSYCGYKGSSRSSLKMHIRQHTGEKPFSCDSCSYATSDHNSLRRHKLRHTGLKPYKCTYCSYACIQSSTFKVHLKTKHPGQENDLLFTCKGCQFRTVNKEIYCTHMATAHDQKVID